MTELRLALAGDTMLGRSVADAITERGASSVVDDELVAVAREADLFVLNLECCISNRGTQWPDPNKPFFFRAPPAATEVLVELGVDCVTLANNHALDYGEEALIDTFDALTDARIASTGAGCDLETARRPARLSHDGFGLSVVALSDHPSDFAADTGRPGIAYADLRGGLPSWVAEAIDEARSADAVLVSPHWGPNMAPAPVPHVVRSAHGLLDIGATLVAGHSAHLFHGVEGPVLYDLGDFVDDYAVDPDLRNDLGLLFFVTLDEEGPRGLEAVPLQLDYCRTRLATGNDAAWIEKRFRAACASFATDVAERDGRFTVELRAADAPPPDR